MAPPFEHLPFFGVVEELTVVNNRDVAVFVGNGLLPVGQTDDAQPARGQADARPVKETLFIGAAVRHAPRHPRKNLVTHRPLASEIDHPRNSAHQDHLEI